jgi:hypothetical protein
MEIWDGVRTSKYLTVHDEKTGTSFSDEHVSIPDNVTLYNKALGSVVAASPRLLPVRIHIGMEPPIHPAVSICKGA